jgi:hypothetical protein
MNNAVKESEQHRVCLIDYYPSFTKGIKNSYKFSKKHNIPFKLIGRGSVDIQKLIYHFCLEQICKDFTDVKSEYQKVMIFYPVREQQFKRFDSFASKIAKVVPIPVFKSKSFNSPDNFYGALKVLERNPTLKRANKVADKLNLYVFANTLKQNKNFSRGTVDFSTEPN